MPAWTRWKPRSSRLPTAPPSQTPCACSPCWKGIPAARTIDPAKLQQAPHYFEDVYQQLSKFTSPDNERVDSDILVFQVPGGMLSNFRNQLAEQGMADKFDEVVREIPVVREALGWIPLVTPTSQIVGTQAMMNVKFGRWKMICKPAQDIALGKYGKAPGPIDPAILAMVEKQTGSQGRHRAARGPAGARPSRTTAPNAPPKGCPSTTRPPSSSPCFPNRWRH